MLLDLASSVGTCTGRNATDLSHGKILRCHPPIDTPSILRDHAGMRWSDQPGYKVEVPRHFLETLAEQMADPETWACMLWEHARTIRKQLEQVDKARR